MEISVRKSAEVQTVQLRGNLRLGEPVESFKRTMEDLLASGDNRIVLDLSEVPMIDSSGIGVLVRYLTQTKLNGGSLKLVNPSEFAVKTLRVVGVLKLFEVFTDQGQAVHSFAAA